MKASTKSDFPAYYHYKVEIMSITLIVFNLALVVMISKKQF